MEVISIFILKAISETRMNNVALCDRASNSVPVFHKMGLGR